jgi:DNA-directed RNA polymerase subunit M/transcription elongation factor TFIIS
MSWFTRLAAAVYRRPQVEQAKARKMRCMNCGHRSVLVMKGESRAEETATLDQLQCTRCGLYTMCSG